MLRYRSYFLIFLIERCLSAQVAVVLPDQASGMEKLAASELILHLNRIYPDERFSASTRPPSTGVSIVLARKTGPPESFSIKASGEKAVLTGADARGVLYAAYALLEKLGCASSCRPRRCRRPAPAASGSTTSAWKTPRWPRRVWFSTGTIS
jgi:hypothetical protein